MRFRSAAALLVLGLHARAPAAIEQTPPNASPANQAARFLLLDKNAIAFVPGSERPVDARPLLVLFHGAGSNPKDIIKPFLDEAQKRGIVLLALKSAGPTWDLITSHFEAYRESASRIEHGDVFPTGDRRAADRAIAALQGMVAIDPRRIATLGFSDGAAFALSYGVSEPEKFSWVGAFSGAFVIVPHDRTTDQRVFIAHGTQDDILPFRQARDSVCPALVNAGRTVRFRAFDNGHVISMTVLREALDDWLVPASRPPASDSVYRCDH